MSEEFPVGFWTLRKELDFSPGVTLDGQISTVHAKKSEYGFKGERRVIYLANTELLHVQKGVFYCVPAAVSKAEGLC